MGKKDIYGYSGITHKLTIGIEGKEYHFVIDSLEGAFEMDAIVAYDLNLQESRLLWLVWIR